MGTQWHWVLFHLAKSIEFPGGVGDGRKDDIGAMSKRAFRAVVARTVAADVASAEDRTRTLEEEERFVRNLLPQGCGEALAERHGLPPFQLLKWNRDFFAFQYHCLTMSNVRSSRKSTTMKSG